MQGYLPNSQTLRSEDPEHGGVRMARKEESNGRQLDVLFHEQPAAEFQPDPSENA